MIDIYFVKLKVSTFFYAMASCHHMDTIVWTVSYYNIIYWIEWGFHLQPPRKYFFLKRCFSLRTSPSLVTVGATAWLFSCTIGQPMTAAYAPRGVPSTTTRWRSPSRIRSSGGGVALASLQCLNKTFRATLCGHWTNTNSCFDSLCTHTKPRCIKIPTRWICCIFNFNSHFVSASILNQ